MLNICEHRAQVWLTKTTTAIIIKSVVHWPCKTSRGWWREKSNENTILNAITENTTLYRWSRGKLIKIDHGTRGCCTVEIQKWQKKKKKNSRNTILYITNAGLRKKHKPRFVISLESPAIISPPPHKKKKKKNDYIISLLLHIIKRNILQYAICSVYV